MVRKAKKEWETWEDEVSDELASPKVKASGRFSLFKGDVKTKTFMVDCKQTAKGSYRLSKDTWDKLCEWSMNEGRLPAIAVKLGNGDRFAVLHETAYAELMGESLIGEGLFDPSKSKAISAGAMDEETGRAIFMFGRRRLVAFPFDRFAKAILESEEE